MQIETWALADCNPAPYNPRRDLQPGDVEYERLKKSIQAFDYVDPIIVNRRTGAIVGGHQRWKVLRDLGYTDAAVSVVDLDATQEKALNVELNKTGGAFDEGKLADLLEDLTAILDDIEVTGFGADEVQALLDQFIEYPQEDSDAEIPEPPTEPITQPGDLWQLGRHRLLCGDATCAKDYDRLMEGAPAAMVFTDPPYNVDYTGKTAQSLKIQNDKMRREDFATFLFEAFTQMRRVTRAGGALYVCHADSAGTTFRQQFETAGWLLKQCLIWVKDSMVMGRQDYHWQHEPILYGWNPGGGHHWAGNRKQVTVLDDERIGIVETEAGATITLGPWVFRVPSFTLERAETSIWRIPRPTQNKEHPTMKPVALVRKAVENSSEREDKVLDPFGGSGTTLVACEETGRSGYLMELDPRYCDVIVARYERLTGEKAVMIHASRTSDETHSGVAGENCDGRARRELY